MESLNQVTGSHDGHLSIRTRPA